MTSLSLDSTAEGMRSPDPSVHDICDIPVFLQALTLVQSCKLHPSPFSGPGWSDSCALRQASVSLPAQAAPSDDSSSSLKDYEELLHVLGRIGLFGDVVV